MTWKINHARGLPEGFRDVALQALGNMPDGDRLCHGDFHVENVLVDGDDYFIIDWVDAAIGSPAADVARTSIILLGAASGLPKALGWLVERLHTVYLREYARLRPFDQEEYQRWLPIIAAARLSEGLTNQHEQDWLIEQAGKLG
jgi:Ser/Thr protein kinase RdoA (MazF antagonist)